MIGALWNLIPTNIKWGFGIGLLVVILTIFGVFKHQSNKIESLEQELIENRLTYEVELNKAHETIDMQNKAINEFKLDRDYYEKTIVEKDKELLATKLITENNIKEELNKDSSTDNQLRIINNILREFSNGN